MVMAGLVPAITTNNMFLIAVDATNGPIRTWARPR
jgi:hypothetical protein